LQIYHFIAHFRNPTSTKKYPENAPLNIKIAP